MYVRYAGRRARLTRVKKELVQWVRKEIGPIASPERYSVATGWPKPVQARLLPPPFAPLKIAGQRVDQVGDTSTTGVRPRRRR